MKKNASAYLFMSGYLILFITFIVVPVAAGVGMSLTYWNTIQPPRFVGLKNYIDLFTVDREFMQHVIPNTLKFSFFAGIGGYVMAFAMAWILAQLTRIPRAVLAIILYSPSLTGGVVMSAIWRTLFSGDEYGYLNNLLLSWGLVDAPVQFLQSPDYLMNIMIIVAIWTSMGIGFLAMLAGILNVNPELYEAGAIDGIKSRLQEIFHITIPSMKPQMLFGAVMAVVGTFNASGAGGQLSGQMPAPVYAKLVVTHIEDHGFLRYEMGYAAAVSVSLLLMIYYLSRIAFKAFSEKD